MSDVIVTENAESETTAEKSNMSPSEFIQKRMGSLSQTEETQSEEETPSAEEESGQEAEVEETEAEESSEESKDDVLSQLDLDSMSEEQLKLLSEKLGSRAVSRFGELTAKRKAAEERLVALEEKFNDRNPLEDIKKSANNPYSEINNIDDLKGKAQEVNNVIEWAEDTIFNAEGYGADDVVTEVKGKEYTKAEVRKQLLDARKAEKKFLPAQLKVLQDREYAKQAKSSLTEKAREEFGWIGKEGDDLNEKYQAMLTDPRLEGLEEFSPELAAQLPYLLAHSANSLYGRRVIQSDAATPTKKGVQLDPPSSMPGSAKSEKQIGSALKNLQNTQKAFRESGSKDDFIKMRTMRFSQ